MKDSVSIIFPHQLFEKPVSIDLERKIFLVEEFLFFRHYQFHQQKIAFHRASMKAYEAWLKKQGYQVEYIDSTLHHSDVRVLIPWLAKQGIKKIFYTDTTDFLLEKRLKAEAAANNISLHQYPSPLFLNDMKDLRDYLENRKKFFQTDFYIHQRKKRKILLEKDERPIGGKWTFDADNRLKYPKNKIPPKVELSSSNSIYEEALAYTEKNFASNYGSLEVFPIYPIDFESSKKWLQLFLKNRFHEFGPYEDAIVAEELFLHHSVLTPMLNVGLLTPQEILDAAIEYASLNEIPLQSLEGFVRQITGWREFMRALYEFKGVEARTKNFWKFKRKIPPSFWTGTTGILPLDATIQKVLKTGYCHHIERLMVLGNFMLLCEFDPDEVYQWFMELFIDSYDWVMVPNVYSMSQFADGGIMATKPYISGSNYIMKMSNYAKGEWQGVWDGLFWRFMHQNRKFFLANPRLSMLIRSFDKMDATKQQQHLKTAEAFLKRLDEENNVG
jgi:deoxyribodipyrimidine photolyase-related protein